MQLSIDLTQRGQLSVERVRRFRVRRFHDSWVLAKMHLGGTVFVVGVSSLIVC